MVFNQNQSYNTNTVYVPKSSKVLVSYRDAASGYSQVLKTATISGTTVSFGSSVSLSPSGTNAQAGLAYDTTNNRAFLSYKDSDDSSKGKAVVYTPPLPGGTATAANFLDFLMLHIQMDRQQQFK